MERRIIDCLENSSSSYCRDLITRSQNCQLIFAVPYRKISELPVESPDGHPPPRPRRHLGGEMHVGKRVFLVVHHFYHH